jgi:regulator of nucleoside diphosphate kinase
MPRKSFSHLTTKEVDILTVMLERSSGAFAFERLLRDKLKLAEVHFSDDVPTDVVTLNSRVFYSVNGKPVGPHIIVQSEGDDLPAFALSIHTMRGLGLLGLAVGEMTTVEYDNGRHETLVLEELVFQPEADRRRRDHARQPAGIVGDRSCDPALGGKAEKVVAFQPKHQISVVAPEDPDDDGPDPAAA